MIFVRFSILDVTQFGYGTFQSHLQINSDCVKGPDSWSQPFSSSDSLLSSLSLSFSLVLSLSPSSLFLLEAFCVNYLAKDWGQNCGLSNEYRLKAHANGRNTVGPNICCVHLHGATTMLALVAYSLKPVKLLGPCKRAQHCWPTTRSNVVTCCIRLHGPLEQSLFFLVDCWAAETCPRVGVRDIFSTAWRIQEE